MVRIVTVWSFYEVHRIAGVWLMLDAQHSLSLWQQILDQSQRAHDHHCEVLGFIFDIPKWQVQRK